MVRKDNSVCWLVAKLAKGSYLHEAAKPSILLRSTLKKGRLNVIVMRGRKKES